jgi:hypothetical protein
MSGDTLSTPPLLRIREGKKVWEDLLKKKIESRLLDAARFAHDRYYAGECDESEYTDSLRHLNEFIVDGKWPDDLKPIGKPQQSAVKLTRPSISSLPE